MTNKELQAILKDYPDDYQVGINIDGDLYYLDGILEVIYRDKEIMLDYYFG